MSTEMEFVNYKQFVEDLPEASNFASTDKGVVSNSTNGPRSMPQTTADKIVAQNTLSGNLAPAFDATRTSENPYKKDEVVMYGGQAYRFKAPHYGAWSGSDVEAVDFSASRVIRIVSNPEYSYAVVDAEGRILGGYKKDGSFEWLKGVPKIIQQLLDAKVDKIEGKSLINAVFANGVKIVSNPEYSYAVVDAEGRLLFGVGKNGRFYYYGGLPDYIERDILAALDLKVDKVDGKSLINEVWSEGSLVQENPEYLYNILDKNNRVLYGLKKNGCSYFYDIDMSEQGVRSLEALLKRYGFSAGQGDWSKEYELKIPRPTFAVLNFSNINSFPVSKTEDLSAYMEFWDMNGNYFRKPVILNAQGNSSLAYPKKNLAIDICNDEWVGDDTFKLKIGDWVSQDSFHIKAYYTDYFRGTGVVGYNLYKDILDTRGLKKNRSWKLALIPQDDNFGEGLGYGAETSETLRVDDGALCFPDGFPCLVYLNGDFAGIYSFQLKKHRDNYVMKKDNKKHIHLDGVLDTNFFSGNINWTAFEVRNPKNLYCMDGSKYDGDNPKELIDPTSASYDPNNSKHVNTYAVKQAIIELSQVYSLVSAAATEEDKKAIIEEYFNVDNIVDYQIFCDLIYNADGVAKNWQWTTWDGHKWFANAYDLDMSFGAMFTGDVIHKPVTSHVGVLTGLPNTYILNYYSAELETRYAELRTNGVADAERIAEKFNSWVKSIGVDAFKAEWAIWSDSPCNRDMVVNTDYWELNVTDGKPDVVYSSQGYNVYSGSASYTTGDEVVYCPTASGLSQGWYYVFTCKADCSGQVPVTKTGFRDNLWRVKNWLAQTIENMDVLYGFNN